MLKKFFLFLIIFIAGCAAPSVQWITYVPQGVNVRKDVVHTVGLSETLWQVSRLYDVPVENIITTNNLNVPVTLKPGQTLKVPDAAPVRPVIPLYPSQKWHYIIIHHSATEKGDAVEIDKAHLLRGFENGIGYHFLIDNGTEDKYDGQIEVTPRWLKQLNGAHCKADGMNCQAIGICLVGNFNYDKVSPGQMDALVYLVKHLMRYYHIPCKNILGHRYVDGAATECPGNKFPWNEFYKRVED